MKFEDYVKIGSDLKELNEQLCDFIVQTSKIRKKTSPIMKRADKAMKALTQLRSDLEELMFFEHPKSLDVLVAQTFPDAATHVFYGPERFSFNGEKWVGNGEQSANYR